jgi:quercetin dioxygenase-like cupin family protein
MCETAKGTAVPHVQIDNARVRVTRWDFAKRGCDTGWHVHGFDYVVVPLFDGVLDIETAEGRVSVEMRNGQSYFREKGVAHNVMNGNDFPCSFVEIELMEERP